MVWLRYLALAQGLRLGGLQSCQLGSSSVDLVRTGECLPDSSLYSCWWGALVPAHCSGSSSLLRLFMTQALQLYSVCQQRGAESSERQTRLHPFKKEF